MTTALDIVTRAYRRAAISGTGDTLSADLASEGMDALNDMMAAWKLAGVDTGHVDMALTDDFPLDPEYREGTVHLLASRIAPGYQFPVGFDADDFFRKIQAAYMQIDAAAMPETLVNMPSQSLWLKVF